ncbi:putative toxin-antitoxin system toxin component, PIN family [Candidatus Woesearchaeota archaeon]|nr:putative toxin-antitoxin system toxin component, PIN family [Candidatus Woesearchaeota archaeon]
MRIRAVLDTNVFVSGIHWTGASKKVLRAWMEGKFLLVSSLPIIDEIIRVLMAFKVPLEPEDISWWESLILEKSSLVFPVEHLTVVKNDPDDDKFIEAAVEGNARYIVSQDKHLLNIKEYSGIKILHPDEFLELLD